MGMSYAGFRRVARKQRREARGRHEDYKALVRSRFREDQARVDSISGYLVERMTTVKELRAELKTAQNVATELLEACEAVVEAAQERYWYQASVKALEMCESAIAKTRERP